MPLAKPSKGWLRRQTLFDPESYTTTLLVLALDNYGPELLGWSPETLRLELEEDFRGKLQPLTVDRLAAGMTLLTTDEFYTSLPSFIQLCNVLAGSPYHPTMFDPADSHEIAWGVTEALLLSPPEDEEPFGDEIRFYIGHTLSEEGVVDPPDILRLALYDQQRVDPLASFADDPTMYQAFFQSQQSKNQEITDMLRENLRELFGQLERLPLHNGSTAKLRQQLRQGLR